MNSRQLFILWAGVAGIVYKIFFPPLVYYTEGYPVLASYPKLALHIFAIALIAGAGIYTFKDKTNR